MENNDEEIENAVMQLLQSLNIQSLPKVIGSCLKVLILERIQQFILKDPTLYLPKELMTFIFSQLSLADIQKAIRVSRAWHHILQDDFVWKGIYMRRGWTINIHSDESTFWRKITCNRLRLESNWENSKYFILF